MRLEEEFDNFCRKKLFPSPIKYKEFSYHFETRILAWGGGTYCCGYYNHSWNNLYNKDPHRAGVVPQWLFEVHAPSPDQAIEMCELKMLEYPEIFDIVKMRIERRAW